MQRSLLAAVAFGDGVVVRFTAWWHLKGLEFFGVSSPPVIQGNDKSLIESCFQWENHLQMRDFLLP